MAHLDIIAEYSLRLTGREVNLIGKALAGLPMTEEQREEAIELNRRVMELKVKYLQKLEREASHAYKNAEKVARDQLDDA